MKNVTDKLNYRVFNSLDSTNSEARKMATSAKPSTWLLALKQTAGRGRRGKRWLSSTDSFTASFLSYPKVKESEMVLRSYIAGIALYDSVTKIGINSHLITLKWPNDLLLNGKKVGGILLETATVKSCREKALIVGFGLNLITSPQLNDLHVGALEPDCLLSSGKFIPKAEEFLNVLIPTYKAWENILAEHGFSKIREEFLRRTIPIGTKIVFEIFNKSTIAKFSGISEDGSLLLESDSGPMVVTAGDVFLIGK